MEKSRFAALSLRFAGWRFEGDPPSAKKYVCLAVPHTSNWDGLLLVMMAKSVGLELEWMIKDDWVKGPMGPLLRRVGAIGVNRSRHTGMVEQMIELFAARERLVLGIPPEGTRSRAEHWKSGFYRIALGAKVPVACGYLDYARKRAGIGPPIDLTGDVRADMDRIRAFYAEKDPKPYDASKYGPLRLREEEAKPAT